MAERRAHSARNSTPVDDDAATLERRRLHDLLDSLPVMIALIERDHTVAFANRAFRDSFGDIVGPTCHQYYFGLDKPCTFCKAFKVFETGQPQHWETPTRGGRIYEVFDLPFRDVDGTEMILEMDVDVTESRRQTSELRDAKRQLSRRATEAEELADQLIRYAPTGIYAIEFDPPRFLTVNDAMVRLTGYSRDELLEMNPFDILDPDSANLFRSRVVLTLSGDEPEPDVEYRVIRKDGSELFVVLNAQFRKDENGRATGAFVIAHDVTERRRAEEVLRRTQERQAFMLGFSDKLRLLDDPRDVKMTAARIVGERLRVSAVGYMEIEMESDVAVAGGEYSDGRMPDLQGRYRLSDFGSVAEVLRRGDEFFADDVTPILEKDAKMGAVADRVNMRSAAFIPLVKRGRLSAYLYAGGPEPRVWSEDDRIILHEAAERTWEAVERASAESALRESEERFRAVLENAIDAAYRRDLVMDSYDYMSPVIEKISGFTPEEFENLSIEEVVERTHPEDRVRVRECLQEAESTGELRCEYRFRRKDGQYVWFGDQAKVIKDAEGRPHYMVGTVRDATRRIEAEQALRTTLERVTRIKEREEGLKQIAQATSASLKKKHLAAAVSRLVARIFDAKHAAIRLANEEGTVLHTVGAFDPEGILQQVEDIAVDADTVSSQAFREGKARFGEDIGADVPEASRRSAETAGVRAYAVLPVTIEGRPIGVLYLGWAHPRSFSRDEVSFMRAVTAQLAVGLQNAHLFQDQRTRRRRIEALHGVMEAAVSAPDIKTAAQNALDYLTGHYDFDVSNIWVASGDSLEVAAHTGYPESYDDMPPVPQNAEFDMCTVFRTGKPLVVPRPDNDSVIEFYRGMGLDLSAYVVYPLWGHERRVGTIALVWSKPQDFTRYDLEFYESVAAEIAVVLENAMLYEAEREAARFGAALAEFDRHIHSSLDFTDVARRALQEGAAALGADSSALSSLSDKGGWETRYDFGFEPSAEGMHFSEEEIPHGRLALDAGEPVAISDTASDPRVNPEVTTRYGIKSVVVAPLMTRGQPIGVLFYNYRENAHVFTKTEIEFVSRLSTSLSLAVENARLYETEHDIAETLQETLVVMPSRVPGIAFSRAYQSATFQSGRVGGDFVDVFEVHGSLVALALGDVSGKGIEAAVTTSLIRTTLRVHALDGLTPGQIGEKANRMLHRFTATDTFVTLWFGLLNTRNGHLRYISAGHPPALVVSAAGEIRELRWGDSVVGAVDEARYTEREECLGMGDRLLLYSDGVTEARSPDGRFLGHEGLLDLLRRHRKAPTTVIAQAILDDTVAFSQGVLRDDAAMLAIEPVKLRQRCPMGQLSVLPDDSSV